MLEEGLDATDAFIGNKQGDAAAAISGAAKKVEAVYTYPYQNHATMEPMNATALYTAENARSGARRERRGTSNKWKIMRKGRQNRHSPGFPTDQQICKACLVSGARFTMIVGGVFLFSFVLI